MSTENLLSVLNIVLMAARMKVNQAGANEKYGKKGLCAIVQNILVRRFCDVQIDCLRLFDSYLIEWAHQNNPKWSEYADIYPVPGEPGGGLNKLCYYQARKENRLWCKDTEYGRARHQMLDDLIKATEDKLKCSTTSTK